MKYAIADHLYVCLIGYGLLSHNLLSGEYRKRPHLIPAKFGNRAVPRLNRGSAPTIAVRSGVKVTLVRADTIDFARAEKPYVALHLGGKKHLVSQSLKELAEELADHGFVRIHKSTLVNLKRVKECRSRLNGDYDLRLEGGETLRLSRHYREDFFAAWLPPPLG